LFSIEQIGVIRLILNRQGEDKCMLFRKIQVAEITSLGINANLEELANKLKLLRSMFVSNGASAPL
jgi:hypothetical protein